MKVLRMAFVTAGFCVLALGCYADAMGLGGDLQLLLVLVGLAIAVVGLLGSGPVKPV